MPQPLRCKPSHLNYTYYIYWLYLWEDEDIYKSGYVGITYNLKDRFVKHRRRFGNFKYKIVFTGNLYQAFALEKHLRPLPNIGWNVSVGGIINGIVCPMLGRKHSKETKEKLRIISASKKHSEEVKAKMKGRKATPEMLSKMRGHKRSGETRARMALAFTGRICKPETKLKIGAAAKKRFLGKTLIRLYALGLV